MVNEFRFGANVIHNANIGELAFKRNVLGELNIPNVPPPVPAAWGVPAVTNLGTTSTWGGGADPYTNQDAAFQWVDNVSIVRGKHAFALRHKRVGNSVQLSEVHVSLPFFPGHPGL